MPRPPALFHWKWVWAPNGRNGDPSIDPETARNNSSWKTEIICVNYACVLQIRAQHEKPARVSIREQMCPL